MVKVADFDIILLDMMMPIMEGFQTFAELQKIGVNQLFLLFLTLASMMIVAKVLHMGAARYFIKSDTPISVLEEEFKKVV